MKKSVFYKTIRSWEYSMDTVDSLMRDLAYADSVRVNLLVEEGDEKKCEEFLRDFGVYFNHMCDEGDTLEINTPMKPLKNFLTMPIKENGIIKETRLVSFRIDLSVRSTAETCTAPDHAATE